MYSFNSNKSAILTKPKSKGTQKTQFEKNPFTDERMVAKRNHCIETYTLNFLMVLEPQIRAHKKAKDLSISVHFTARESVHKRPNGSPLKVQYSNGQTGSFSPNPNFSPCYSTSPQKCKMSIYGRVFVTTTYLTLISILHGQNIFARSLLGLETSVYGLYRAECVLHFLCIQHLSQCFEV